MYIIYTHYTYPMLCLFGVFRVGNSGLANWGNRRAGAGGIGVLEVICAVFKKLSKNSSR